MLQLAIGLLWFLLSLLILCGVVALVLYGINQFIYELPANIVKGVWFCVLLIAIIALLTILAGGGLQSYRPFRLGVLLFGFAAPLRAPAGHHSS